jgi:hypothetical protein
VVTATGATATLSSDQWLVSSHWNLIVARGTAVSGARHCRVQCPRRQQPNSSNDSIWLGAIIEVELGHGLVAEHP